MKTIQVVLDEELLDAADREAKIEKLNRSELVRRALRDFLKRRTILALEESDRAGYEKLPVRPGEFDHWDKVQAWPED